MPPTRSASGFSGLRVASFESRRRGETARLIRRAGGDPLAVPAMREVPLHANPQFESFASRFFAGGIDVLVLTTGVGTEAMCRALAARTSRAAVRRRLAATTLVSRGPKPAAALAALGLKPDVVAPEPDTWREVMRSLGKIGLKGRRVAVQEYGTPNVEFLRALEARGAEAVRVPIYRWTLPADTAPLEKAVREIAARRVPFVLFTNANQVNNLFEIATRLGLAGDLKRSLAGCVVASVGPTCSGRLKQAGVKVDFEPARPRLADLVEGTARSAARLLDGRAPYARRNGAPARLDDCLFLRACRGEKTERPPVWLMRQAGRYMKNYRDLRSKVSMLELCKHPDLVAEVTVDAVRRLDVDAAILFSDLLLIVEPLGFHLEYSKGEGPVIAPRLERPASVDRLREVDVERDLGYVAEAVRKTRAALPADIPLLGFSGAPFTLASYLIEGGGSRNFVRTKSFMYNHPAAWHKLLGKLSRSLGDYLNMQLDAGAQAVQVFDSWVGCLSRADYRRYVLPHSRALLAAVRPGAPVIHFGTQTGGFLEEMKEALGGRRNGVVGVDWRLGLDEARRRLGRIPVMGNMDPVALFGTRAGIRAEARRILKQNAGRPGFIFNLGHGILPETPVENVRHLVRVVKGA